jgi:hypothetical protein
LPLRQRRKKKFCTIEIEADEPTLSSLPISAQISVMASNPNAVSFVKQKKKKLTKKLKLVHLAKVSSRLKNFLDERN